MRCPKLRETIVRPSHPLQVHREIWGVVRLLINSRIEVELTEAQALELYNDLNRIFGQQKEANDGDPERRTSLRG